jgi:predicted O-linked N-acetylglucosamine transferase (SPINDLY family)
MPRSEVNRDVQSLELLQRAAQQNPRNPETWFHLANAFAVGGEHAKAIAAYERALELAPAHPDLLVNLGITFGQAGNTGRAEACYREVLQRQPTHIGALGNLAYLFFRSEDFAAALESYDRLLAAMPHAGAEVWNNRGICQQQLGDRASAEQSFRHALALEPESAEINANLGFLLYDSRRYEPAGAFLRKAHALDPRRALVAAESLDVDLQFADWRDFERKRDEILAAVGRFAREPRQSVPPYLLLALCDDPALQLAAAKRWAWPERKPAPALEARERRKRQEPLRLGFVSSAFHEHPVPRLLVELLERIDRERFEVHAYALGRGQSDALRARVERAAALAELGHLPTSAMAERIRGDSIDMLFDLTGYTGQARPDLFASRAAPVQVNYLGYAGTLGAAYYDFIITDSFTTPPDARSDFVERICDLGECYLPSDTRRASGDRPARSDYGLRDDALVLMSQAATYKILPALFDVWMRLLRNLPDATLWLRPVDSIAERNLRLEADRRGVDPARLAFAPSEPVERYLARYALADVYLDTYPFGSHTTVNDALWMGLPVVTVAGRSMASRTSASEVRAAALAELVAASVDEYEALVLSLARERTRLRALTDRLHSGVRTTALFDIAGYTQAFEAGVERMWNDA